MDRDTFLNHLRRSSLLTIEAIDEAAARFPETAPARAIARALVAEQVLTRFQARRLLAGKPTGLVLGPYRVLDQLGRGVTGPVFKAVHAATERLVAIKIIRPRVLKDSGLAFDLFLREVRAAAQLHHTGIVTAYDAGMTGGKHFLVMEYIGGPSLEKLVQEQGPLSVPVACELMRQVAEALQYAHEKGIVHRDIKPANLLIAHAPGLGASRSYGVHTNPGPPRASPETGHFSDPAADDTHRKGLLQSTSPVPVVKLIDFGLARLRHTGMAGASGTIKVEPGTVWGTVDYIAPEQAENIHAADIRSDLYSLGCTFYYALTGQVPFPGGNDLEKLVKHLLYQAPSVAAVRPDVPASLAAIIERLMAKQRARRFQTPAELARELVLVQKRGLSLSPRHDESPFPPPDKAADPPDRHDADSTPLLGDARSGSPSTVDDLVPSAGALPLVDARLLDDWRVWTAIVEAFVHGRGNYHAIDPQSFHLLHKRLVESCETHAAATEGPRREFLQKLAELVKPWLSQEILMQTDREILSSLLWHSQRAERGLREIAAPASATDSGQTMLGGILGLFKRR